MKHSLHCLFSELAEGVWIDGPTGSFEYRMRTERERRARLEGQLKESALLKPVPGHTKRARAPQQAARYPRCRQSGRAFRFLRSRRQMCLQPPRQPGSVCAGSPPQGARSWHVAWRRVTRPQPPPAELPAPQPSCCLPPPLPRELRYYPPQQLQQSWRLLRLPRRRCSLPRHVQVRGPHRTPVRPPAAPPPPPPAGDR